MFCFSAVPGDCLNVFGVVQAETISNLSAFAHLIESKLPDLG